MMELSKETRSYKELFSMINGAIKSRIMIAGLELGVFDYLADPISAGSLAEKIKTHPANTARYLDALATVELIDKRQGLYWNRPLTQMFLSRSSPTYIGDLLFLHQQMCVSELGQIADLVKFGPRASGNEAEIASPVRWARAVRAGAQWVTGEMGNRIAEIVSGLDGFSGFSRMLDMGGGHGMFAQYIIQAHPNMEAFIFDRPAVLVAAEEYIGKYGLADRIRTMPGDYIRDDIGGDYDLIFASATLNFAKDRIDGLFLKVHAALKPGGYFLSFQDGLTHERTRPETMLGHLLDSLRDEADFVFDQGFLAEAMLRAGFRQVRSRTIETPMGPMDLDAARKSVDG